MAKACLAKKLTSLADKKASLCVHTTHLGLDHDNFVCNQLVVRDLGHVSRTPQKHFGPAKPFLVNLHLKRESCILLKRFV